MGEGHRAERAGGAGARSPQSASEHTPSPPQGNGEASAREKHLADAKRSGLALCLSGGGYRAALFHLGALRRLNELGVLSKVDTISAVSGGSIVAAFLAARLLPWPSAGTVARDWEERIADPVREFTEKNIRTLWFFKRLVPWNWADSTIAVEALARRYEKEVIGTKLAELPKRPRFIFSATDMAFGVNWVSERACVGDYQVGYQSPPPPWPVARAVAASSCFPPAFDPLPIGIPADKLRCGKLAADDADRKALINGLRLSDGGVYDNMGLEPVWKDHQTVLVSDGGASLDFRPDKGFPRRLGRYLPVISNQAGALRKRWLISNFLAGELSGTYWGIGGTARTYDDESLGYPEALVDDVISEVRTDLDYFSPAEQAVLENHGYLMAEAAVKRHCRELIAADAQELVCPYAEYMDRERVERELATSSKRKVLGRWGLRARLRAKLAGRRP